MDKFYLGAAILAHFDEMDEILGKTFFHVSDPIFALALFLVLSYVS